MTERQYDVVLYGASGFVGRQTVQYFVRHAGSALRWAVAGRNPAQLQAVRALAGAANAGLLVADCHNRPAVDAMVSQTRVLLNTAGPFALYGGNIVDACVRWGTHYVDITGETPWVRDLIDRCHDQAASQGTRIIPLCGFDSVPSDLGAYLMARYMRKELGVSCQEIKAYFQMNGGVNGGTLASAFTLFESGQAARMSDPFLLNPPFLPAPQAEHLPQESERNRDLERPVYDADMGDWVGPFVMAGANTRVVRRSAALFEQWGEPYGPGFRYQEFQKFDPPWARAKATLLTGALGAFSAAMARPFSRRMLKSILPKPGRGPSAKVMDAGWFRCELLGIAQDGRKVRGLIAGQGDPGNRATVTFLCEAALALALDDLPGGPQRGGLLTPATGLGDVLVARLRREGMTIEIGTISPS